MERTKLRAILKSLRDAPKSFVPDASEPLDMLIFGILSARSPHQIYQQAFANLKKYPWADVDQKLTEDDVIAIIQPLFQTLKKARWVKAALKKVREDFGRYSLKPLADRPEDEIMSYLTGFSGVGLKVASMVAAYGFDLPWLPIDVHIERILKKCGILLEKLDLEKGHRFIRSLDLTAAEVKDLFLLVQEHGRRVCTARNPDCVGCLIKEQCLQGSPY